MRLASSPAFAPIDVSVSCGQPTTATRGGEPLRQTVSQYECLHACRIALVRGSDVLLETFLEGLLRSRTENDGCRMIPRVSLEHCAERHRIGLPQAIDEPVEGAAVG